MEAAAGAVEAALCGAAWGLSAGTRPLRVDPAQRTRLEAIRVHLTGRITEAEREGWTGEAEGLKISLAAANAKLTQLDTLAARRTDAVHLGTARYRDIAGRTATIPQEA